MAKHYKQPVTSYRPSRKVKASTIGSLLASAVAAGALVFGVEVPGELVVQLGVFLTATIGVPLVSWLSGYFTYEVEDDGPDGPKAEAPEDGILDDLDDESLDVEVEYDESR